jgi:hypothetical protein
LNFTDILPSEVNISPGVAIDAYSRISIKLVQGPRDEWAQNIQQFRWGVDRINEELSKVMRKAYRAVRQVSVERKIDMRTAAFVLAIQRVGQAALARILLNTKVLFD